MAILQILSQKSSLYEWFASYEIEAILPPRKRFGGIARPPKGATRQIQVFGKF